VKIIKIKNMYDYSDIKDISQDKGRTTGQISEQLCKKIVAEVNRVKELGSENKAMVLIAGLMQSGGSNRGAGNSISYSLFNVTLNASEFGRLCKDVGGGTPRQFCRTMGTEIARAASLIQEEGDLARQMKIDHPNLSLDEAIWCSNFQSLNPECPEYVRQWLVRDLKRRFNNRM